MGDDREEQGACGLETTVNRDRPAARDERPVEKTPPPIDGAPVPPLTEPEDTEGG